MPRHRHPTQMTVQATQKKLGDMLYLFESSTTTHRCLITAHGGYWFGTRRFTVPRGVTISLYAPHGTALIDPGIDFLKADAVVQPEEVIRGGAKCYDYQLSKFQGRHGSQNETYQAINRSVTTGDQDVGALQRDANLALDRGDEGTLNQLLVMASTNRNAHVVTVRNRWFNKLGVSLTHVISKVRKSYPEVTEFHCSHCRSNVLRQALNEASNVMGRVFGGRAA